MKSVVPEKINWMLNDTVTPAVRYVIDVLVILLLSLCAQKYLLAENVLRTSYALLVFLSVIFFQGITLIANCYSQRLEGVLKYWLPCCLLAYLCTRLFLARHLSFNAFMLWGCGIFAGLVCVRIVLNLLLPRCTLLKRAQPTVAIFTDSKLDQRVIRSLVQHNSTHLKGVFSDAVPGEQPESCAGDGEALIRQASAGEIDKIYIVVSLQNVQKIAALTSALAETLCTVALMPAVPAFHQLPVNVERIDGAPALLLFDTPMHGLNRFIKRVEDIVIASIILLLISPILLAISIAIKATSRGPVIFRQTRYGLQGKPISVWKFRSMKVMENDASVVQATRNDPRVTPIGSFLRKTSLDELPQFINVLKGDMSIVGPRPHAVAHNEYYRTLIPGYMLRHKMKPGITGWAQINGWRGETDTLYKMEKRIEFDLEYIRNWSLGLDLKIILITVFKGFVNKAAY